MAVEHFSTVRGWELWEKVPAPLRFIWINTEFYFLSPTCPEGLNSGHIPLDKIPCYSGFLLCPASSCPATCLLVSPPPHSPGTQTLVSSVLLGGPKPNIHLSCKLFQLSSCPAAPSFWLFFLGYFLGNTILPPCPPPHVTAFYFLSFFKA